MAHYASYGYGSPPPTMPLLDLKTIAAVAHMPVLCDQAEEMRKRAYEWWEEIDCVTEPPWQLDATLDELAYKSIDDTVLDVLASFSEESVEGISKAIAYHRRIAYDKGYDSARARAINHVQSKLDEFNRKGGTSEALAEFVHEAAEAAKGTREGFEAQRTIDMWVDGGRLLKWIVVMAKAEAKEEAAKPLCLRKKRRFD